MSEATTEAESKAVDLSALSALGLYNQDEAADTAYARLLILGAPKIGKTTAVVSTAPAPLIINCDGMSATKYAAKQGAKFSGFDVTGSRASWLKAQGIAKKAVEADVARTIVVDTMTLLADDIRDELMVQGFSGFELYGELASSLLGGMKRLYKLDAHVIIIAHMTPGEGTEAGVIPLIAGQAKVKIPAIAHDVALFEYNLDTGARQFAVGPQRNWAYSGRNVKRSAVVAPTIPALFTELGIAL